VTLFLFLVFRTRGEKFERAVKILDLCLEGAEVGECFDFLAGGFVGVGVIGVIGSVAGDTLSCAVSLECFGGDDGAEAG